MSAEIKLIPENNSHKICTFAEHEKLKFACPIQAPDTKFDVPDADRVRNLLCSALEEMLRKKLFVKSFFLQKL